MAETRRPPSAAERVAAAERAVPGALELAALVPQAARIERRLLRALRVQLLPHRRAADEAELWTSDLVELRAVDGLVLRADVQELLRQRGRALLQQRTRRGAAAERTRRLLAARDLLRLHHANAPPLVQLEEEIAWIAMEQAEPQGPIQAHLQVALAALVRDGRVGVARWAARALPRLPEVARGTTAAWQLSVASSDRLPAARGSTLPAPAGMRVVDLQALAPHLGQMPLGVRRIGDILELGAVGPGGMALMVPASEPRFVTVDSPDAQIRVDIAITTGDRHEMPVGWEPLNLQAADGRRWRLPVLSDEEQHALDGVTQVQKFRMAEPALVTVVAEGRALSASGRAGSAQAVTLHPVEVSLPDARPLPPAIEVPDGARVVSTSIDRHGALHPVVGTWSDDGEAGPTVLARGAAGPEGCIGAPVVFEGRLAGVVTQAHPESSGRRGDLRLYVETRPERLLSGHVDRGRAAAITVELLPAGHGQAVLIGWGPPGERHHMLVDGGPKRTAKAVIARVRHAIGEAGLLELVAISHADANRLEGIIELLATGVPVADVWFNGPAVLAEGLGAAGAHSLAVERLEQGIRSFVKRPNAAFSGRPVLVPPEGPLPRIGLPGGATITVLAPAEPALAAVAKAWSREAAKRGQVRQTTSPSLGPEEPELEPTSERSPRALKFGGDSSVNNASSLVLLFEYQDHAVLLPGDAHARPLVAALRRLAAERQRSGLFVDVFVMPHGGSRGNIVPELFEVLEAGTWAVSTDGSMFGHPDAEAIELVARRAQGATLAFNYRGRTTERWASASFQREHKVRVVLPEQPEGGIELAVGALAGQSQAAS